MQTIPQALIQADSSGTWPFGIRLAGSLFADVAPFMSSMDFVLLPLAQIGKEACPADFNALYWFAKKPPLARQYRLYVGKNTEGPEDLPWLDIEKALVIGGGADYGGDTWIAIDSRPDPRVPRVVINHYHHYGLVGARTAPSHITWKKLAPSMEHFLVMLGPHRNPAPIADNSG